MNGIYNFIDKNQNDILHLLNQNQNLKKLLCIKNDNPLSYVLSAQNEKSTLIDTYIVNDYFSTDIKKVADCKIYFYFIDSHFDSSNNPIGTFRYGIDIICNQNLWRLKEKKQSRWTLIMNEIEKTFHCKNITGLGRCYLSSTSNCHLQGTNYNIAHSVLNIYNSVRGTN